MSLIILAAMPPHDNITENLIKTLQRRIERLQALRDQATGERRDHYNQRIQAYHHKIDQLTKF